MREVIVRAAKRSPRLRAAVRQARRLRSHARDARGFSRYLRGKGLDELSDRFVIRLAYNLLLEREPDAGGQTNFEGWLRDDLISRREVVAKILDGKEFERTMAYRELGPSLHRSRGTFVRSLPRARRILDLGGSSRWNHAGALVDFDYPHTFDELVIVELPADERNQHYRNVIEGDAIRSPLGPVRFRYHTMTSLDGIPDESFDLVYCGQSIEHVTESEADKVLHEARRVLRRDGFLALDTPNGAVCRLQQDDFIDPDHKYEYTHAEIAAKLTASGFRVVRQHGLNDAGASVAAGVFDLAETARHWGLFDDLERCYLLAYVCVRADDRA